MPNNYRLRAEQGPFAGQTFDLNGSVSVGRQEGNELTLADNQLSRKHARFDSGPQGLSVTDLGAANGVFVNGQRITGTATLQPGDQVGIGASVLRVELAAGAQAAGDATRVASAPPAWQQPQAAPAPAWQQPSGTPSPGVGFPPAGLSHAAPAPPPARRSSLPMVLLGVGGALFLCVCIAVGGLLVVASRGGDSTTAGSGGSSSGGSSSDGSSSSGGNGGASGGSGAGPTAPSFGGGSGSGGASGGGAGGVSGGGSGGGSGSAGGSSGGSGSGGASGGASGGSGGASGGASGGGNTSSRPQAGAIAGQITTVDGRPLPAGVTGNVRISGNTINGEAKTYEVRTDPQGRYSQSVTDGIYSVVARVTFTHNGSEFNLLLHPNDGKGSEGRYESRNGAVKDFTWRLSGLTRGDLDPDLPDSYYGQIANVVPNAVKIPPGSKLELTFTPTGPLADGSRGETQTREVQGAPSITQAPVFDLPLGTYTVTAQIVGPQARAVNVCVGQSAGECAGGSRRFATQAAVAWTAGQTGVPARLFILLGE